MRVAIVADSHFDQHKRFDECIRLHDWIAEDCRSRGIDLFLHGGDVFERKSTELERLAAFSWFQKMADLAPGVVVRGNHDKVDELPALAKLDGHPITVVETADVVEVAGALVACVAWPRKSALLAATGADSHEGSEALASEALRNVLRGLGDDMRGHDGPTMLLAHAMVRDSVTSTGQPLVGCDMEIGLDDLALVGASAYFLGHIHMMQHWLIAGAPCWYPGSPRRTAFGELEPKGYLLATWEGGRLVSVEFIEAPATPMILLDGEHFGPTRGLELSGIGAAAMAHDSLAGAEVRIRYRVASDQRTGARSDAEEVRERLFKAGAAMVQIEEVVRVEQRTRADAIPAKAPLVDKVQAYWTAKHFEPGDRRAALLAKLQTIEESNVAAA